MRGVLVACEWMKASDGGWIGHQNTITDEAVGDSFVD
jgi:hypothetical protein